MRHRANGRWDTPRHRKEPTLFPLQGVAAHIHTRIEVNTMSRRFKVGIVGLQPGRSWAARAHVPALRALADRFEIAGVANTSKASAEAAAAAMGIPRAYDNVAALVADPEVDIVAVTVKVPHHF